MVRTARIAAGLVGVALVLAAGGCSAGDAVSGFNMFSSATKKDSNLKVWLDGHEATQSTVKKALKGHAQFAISERVSTSPKFKYEIITPKEMGDVFGVYMQVHQKFEADFSDVADYSISPADANNRDAQFKPGVVYDLASLGSGWKILNKSNQQVSAVQFQPGVEYLLVISVRADKSDSMQVYFKTQ